MNYYKAILKYPNSRPIFVYAKDETEAKKMAFADYLKRRGMVDSVDLYSTVDSMIDHVELQID